MLSLPSFVTRYVSAPKREAAVSALAQLPPPLVCTTRQAASRRVYSQTDVKGTGDPEAIPPSAECEASRLALERKQPVPGNPSRQDPTQRLLVECEASCLNESPALFVRDDDVQRHAFQHVGCRKLLRIVFEVCRSRPSMLQALLLTANCLDAAVLQVIHGHAVGIWYVRAWHESKR